MNPNPSLSSTLPAPDATCVASRLIAATAVAVLGVQLFVIPVRAQEPAYDDENAEVMTRGPVHEAFATVVDYNPGRGLVTNEPPPDPIDELPPEERPEGEDVAWIPGYWAWDDEQSDYIWVSGTWRVPPPGREWVPGYWSESGREFLWISGYWAEIETRETTYLPPPPESLESGPNVAAPSDDYGWSPGCWIWYDGRYAWRPGYWERGRGDWIWIPSYYVWTPHGYIFVDGYWDYEVRRRGVVYAPVHFRSRVYARRGYHYSPRIVFNLGLFSDHLFIRPRWSHYYFGDYYAPRYESAGFYFTFSYYSSWRGYDPFYSHWRWEHRRDRDWDRRYRASYRYRRENEAARPPRTWSAQVAMASSTTITTENRIIVAGTTSQLTSTRDNPVKFRKVDETERRTLSTRGQDVRVARDQRRTTESRLASADGGRSAEISEPRKVERQKSPIASRPQRELPKNLTPPKAPKSPKVDPDATAKASGRPDPGKRDRAEQARPGTAVDTRRRSATEERARQPDSARSNSQQEAQEKDRESRARRAPTAERPGRAEDDAARARMDAQALSRKEAETRARNETEAQSNREASQREPAAKARDQNEAKQRAAEAQRKKDQQTRERRASEEKEPRGKRDGQAQSARESESRTRNAAQAGAEREASQREQAARTQAQADARAQAAEKQKSSERQAAERRTKETADRARQQEAQAQTRKSAEARQQREAQAKIRQESESRAKREAQAQAQAKARTDADQREQAAKARAQEQAQARARAESQARERQQAVARTGEAQTAERRESASQRSNERTQQSKQPPPKQQKRAADEEDSKDEKGKGRP